MTNDNNETRGQMNTQAKIDEMKKKYVAIRELQHEMG